MANEHLKKYLVMKQEVRNIFQDLEEYLVFCKKQGYVYDEAHLYNEKTPWGEFLKAMADGKQIPFEYNSGYCIVSWLYTKPFPFYISKEKREKAIKELSAEVERLKKEIDSK